MALSEQDREGLRLMLREGVEGIECSHFEDIIPCASDADALVPVVEAIVARHVSAALTEAAERIEGDPGLRLGHNVSAICSCLRCDVAKGAARIVRDLRT